MCSHFRGDSRQSACEATLESQTVTQSALSPHRLCLSGSRQLLFYGFQIFGSSLLQTPPHYAASKQALPQCGAGDRSRRCCRRSRCCHCCEGRATLGTVFRHTSLVTPEVGRTHHASLRCGTAATHGDSVGNGCKIRGTQAAVNRTSSGRRCVPIHRSPAARFPDVFHHRPDTHVLDRQTGCVAAGWSICPRL